MLAPLLFYPPPLPPSTPAHMATQRDEQLEGFAFQPWEYDASDEFDQPESEQQTTQPTGPRIVGDVQKLINARLVIGIAGLLVQGVGEGKRANQVCPHRIAPSPPTSHLTLPSHPTERTPLHWLLPRPPRPRTWIISPRPSQDASSASPRLPAPAKSKRPRRTRRGSRHARRANQGSARSRPRPTAATASVTNRNACQLRRSSSLRSDTLRVKGSRVCSSPALLGTPRSHSSSLEWHPSSTPTHRRRLPIRHRVQSRSCQGSAKYPRR